MTQAGIVTRSINELLFPIGCSVVLYVADVLGAAVAAERQTAVATA